jgi:predicted transcriptional regulator
MQGHSIWSRRDRTQLIKDIMLILANGSVSKTRLQNMAGLNKRLFETYVENILVRYGLVEKRRVNRTTYYMLTPKGRAYLHALIISDLEVLVAEEEFAKQVAEELTRRGIRFGRSTMVGDDSLRLPVDFSFETPRGPLYAYLAATHAAALAKHCAAAAAKRLTNGTVILVAPEQGSGNENGVVPVIHYHAGSVEDAADRLEEAVMLASHGNLSKPLGAPERQKVRVVRV